MDSEEYTNQVIAGLQSAAAALELLTGVVKGYTARGLKVPSAVRYAGDQVTNGSWGLDEVTEHLKQKRIL